MNKVNCTPHVVRLNDGTEFPPSGILARVSSVYEEICPGFYSVEFGDISGLPEPKLDTLYIVSTIVAQAANRPDVISPATGHPEAIRKDGQIVSVPGFVVN